MVVERLTSAPKDFIEHPSHGEYGRAGVDTGVTNRNFPHLATGGRSAFDNRHSETASRQFNGARQAADPGPYHDDLFISQGFIDRRHVDLDTIICLTYMTLLLGAAIRRRNRRKAGS